jgi:hypothetical protein
MKPLPRSPYDGLSPAVWERKTEEIVRAHPLKTRELVEVVLGAWEAIFHSRIGPRGFRIGVDIFPKPQILGFLLHELIPLELQTRYPSEWRIEQTASDKDIVNITDSQFSIEIKTSSSSGSIYGNRSYAQQTETGKKDKAGYYLAINFQKCNKETPTPCITSIRFGWLDHTDWMAQKAPSGQQARLSGDVERTKFLTLYSL